MRFSSILIAVVAATQVGATDCGNALRDSGFDLWCGDTLCDWKVDRGDVRKVSTWNDGDPGVELVGSAVVIEQLSPVTSDDGSCLELTMMANVDPSVDVELDIDVFGDGSVEHTERIPATHWKPLVYDIAIAGTYGGIRFKIAKTGDGTAELANIGAKTVDNGCAGITPIVPAPAPLGASCDPNSGSACQSDLCAVVEAPHTLLGVSSACAECDDTHPCSVNSDVCGLGEPVSPVFQVSNQCMPLWNKQSGERCYVDVECASETCMGNRCAACTGTATGCTCAPSSNGTFVCNPGQHTSPSGTRCATDDDCASGMCSGPTSMVCDDGRPCGSDADCPFDGSDGPLSQSACTFVGYLNGICR